MKFIDKTSAKIIQQKLIDRFGGIHGIRNDGALESAIKAAEQRFHYETEDFAKLAATYAFIFRKLTPFLMKTKESQLP